MAQQTLLANKKQRYGKAAEKAAVLRRAPTVLQWVRTALETELGLAQSTVQRLRAEERWATEAKKLDGLKAGKQEAQKCRRALRRLSAEAQELREVRGRLTKAEKANLVFTSKLVATTKEIQTRNLLLQKAAALEVNPTDAKDLLAELNARVSDLQALGKEDRIRNLQEDRNLSLLGVTILKCPAPAVETETKEHPSTTWCVQRRHYRTPRPLDTTEKPKE